MTRHERGTGNLTTGLRFFVVFRGLSISGLGTFLAKCNGEGDRKLRQKPKKILIAVTIQINRSRLFGTWGVFCRHTGGHPFIGEL